MSAFPSGAPTAGSLHDRRNELRTEVATLRGIVSQLSNWVEQLERDRIEQVGTIYANDAAFDAAWNPLAGTLLTAVRNETSLATTSFLYRMRNALQLQAFDHTHYQTTNSSTWNITHNLGYDPQVAVYTWNTDQTVLSLETAAVITYPTAGVSVTVTLPIAAQGVAKLS